MGIRYSAVPGHTKELADALNEELSASWRDKRGLEIVAIGVSSMKANEEDEQMIKEMQKEAAYMDPRRAAAHMTNAQANAMQSAAANENAGPMMAFAGMNMASQAGGINANDLYQMGAQQQAEPQAGAQAGWTCSCGKTGNTGNFCSECGSPKPAPQAANTWTCASCGAQNKGKFCAECGSPKPAGIPQYKCDKCGWEPSDPANPPKFCPECGDPFDDGDAVS